ncbi:MAG: FtsX-like permease family protein, partial [Clostridiales bacterium]|nr:FtsX-like permease family protein [Clostridiales bacterium]
MLSLVLRKILNNKWLIICLLLGMIITVAMVSSIPLYTNGILQRLLVKDLETYQQEEGVHSGLYEIRLDLYQTYSKTEGQLSKTYDFFKEHIEGDFIEDLDVETVARTNVLSMDFLYVTPEEYYGEKGARTVNKVFGLDGLDDHIQLLGGRLPENNTDNEIIECLIMPAFQKEYNILLDRVYIMENYTKKDSESFKIMPVGLIEPATNNDPWWVNPDEYSSGFLIDYQLMKEQFVDKREFVTKSEWFFIIDYKTIDIQQLPMTINTLDAQNKWLDEYSGTKASFNAIEILQEYFTRARQLTTTLWVLQVPILIMLAFYLFMTAQLVVQNDRNEISILKSRGAARRQIFLVYLIQSALLAVVAVILGPILGIVICKMLGASNGFLEFISRTALQIKMVPNAILFAVIAGLFSIVVMMIPVLYASRISIVELKQKKAR